MLNVKPTATPAQIDAAYRRLMQRYHPNARSSPQTLDRLRELNEAWCVLSDPTQRAAYDRARLEGIAYQPQSIPVTVRAMPQSAVADFGAPHFHDRSCLVGIGVAVVLMFAVGILLWGLSQQSNFAAWWGRAQNELGAYLPFGEHTPTSLTEANITPTPDPRCRNGCETPPAGCVVKGDVEPNGAHFFYLPNDAGYTQVRMELAKGDRWFCAVSDAQAAGWTRKAPTEPPPPTPPPDAFTTPVARRNVVVCADNAALRQGPGNEFPVVQNLAPGARVAVTGINGDWSVVTIENKVAYIQSALLCTPTRAASAASSALTPDANAATPLSTDDASPVANPAVTTFKYPAPRLIEPTNGAHYWCSRDLIFEWALDASPLGSDEFFLVESKPHERDTWTALADWTKDTRVVLHPSKGGGGCDTVWWSNTGAYQWRVSVVRGNKAAPQHLSPFSAWNDIVYAQ
jgi:uncharacterized protein YgiM (DUF1202 family)